MEHIQVSRLTDAHIILITYRLVQLNEGCFSSCAWDCFLAQICPICSSIDKAVWHDQLELYSKMLVVYDVHVVMTSFALHL